MASRCPLNLPRRFLQSTVIRKMKMTTDRNQSSEESRPQSVSRFVGITNWLGAWTLACLAITLFVSIVLYTNWAYTDILERSGLWFILGLVVSFFSYVGLIFPFPFEYLKIIDPRHLSFFLATWFFGSFWLYGILLQILFVQLDWIKSRRLRLIAQLLLCLLIVCLLLGRIFFKFPLSLNHP